MRRLSDTIARAAMVTALLAASMSLSSCAFLLGDPIPSWIARADAELDLGAEIAAHTGSTIRYSPTVWLLDAAGRGLASFQTRDGHSRLFVLDSRNLAFERTFDDTSGLYIWGNWGVDANGRPVSGHAGAAFALDASSAPQALAATGDGYYCSDGINNYIVNGGSTSITITTYSTDWASQTATMTIPYLSGGGSWTVADFGMSAAGPRILLEDGSGIFRAYGWPSMSALLAAADLASSAVLKVASPSLSSGMFYPGCWLCADGLVHTTGNTNSGTISLTHEGFDGSASTYTIERTNDIAVGFGPESSRWTFYDMQKGRLYEERPWW